MTNNAIEIDENEKPSATPGFSMDSYHKTMRKLYDNGWTNTVYNEFNAFIGNRKLNSALMKWMHHAVQDNRYFHDGSISSPALIRITISTIYERDVPIEFIEKHLIAGLIDYDDYDTIKQNCIS